MKDTSQLKILQTWINIRINSFLDKYDETKMNEGALEIISRIKIWACSLKNIAPSHFTYYCILLFLWNKDSFQIQPSVDRTIFSKTCLLFYLLSFFIRTDKLLMRLIVTNRSYHVPIFHKTFAFVNGKKFLLILINLIFAWFERTIVGDSLHIWRNFWWLIITSTKLM